MVASNAFKKMTLCALSLLWAPHSAAILSQQQFATHLRLILTAPLGTYKIVQKEKSVEIHTFNLELFEQLVGDINTEKFDKAYIERVSFDKKDFPIQPAKILLSLKSPDIKLFHFYQNKNKREVIDFWQDEKNRKREVAATASRENSTPVITPDSKKSEKKSLFKTSTSKLAPETKQNKAAKKVTKALKKEVPRPSRKEKNIASLEVFTQKKRKKITAKKVLSDYREFRYGAALVWDYNALLPVLKDDIQLRSKAVDFLYAIKDREYLKDKKEAHMQLSINFYRKEKYGLMNKSIRLYNDRYGLDQNADLNDFLKANALLRSNIKKPDKGVLSSAINLLEGILARTEEYEMKRAISRYIIQYAINNNNFVKTLQLAKNLFVLSRDNFDPDMKEFSVNIILYSLATLKQLEKIQEFLDDKYVLKAVPRQKALAYEMYVALERGDTKKTIQLYEDNKKSLVPPLLPSINYNLAEAYFRSARYEEALKMFDDFASGYSYYKEASQARLRIALCYDFLGKNIAKVIDTYKRALDRSSNVETRFEAKVRYAALFLNRRKDLREKDHEKVVFLDPSEEEKKFINSNMKKLLWMTRLRYFSNQKQFKRAMTYLESIPLQSLRPIERETFLAEGSEILFGMMSQEYEGGNYSKAIKLWSLFKEKYLKRRKINPYLHFILADSYIKLGLNKKFSEEITLLGNLKMRNVRSFPHWVERKDVDLDRIIAELQIRKEMLLQNYDEVIKIAKTVENKKGISPLSYYRGMSFYNKKDFSRAIKEFENLFIESKGGLPITLASESVEKYIESIFKSGDDEKLDDVFNALNKDLEQKEIDPLVLDRISYLYLESLLRRSSPDYKEIEGHAKTFLDKYKESKNRARVKYIRGVASIKRNQIEEGKKILNDLINDKEVSDYLKGLAKSELSLIELEEKSL